MKEFAGTVLLIVSIGTWCCGMARAETNWKYVPGVGTLIGGVKIMEDFVIPKK